MVGRPARTLGIMVALSVLGVLGLGYVAQRYARILEEPISEYAQARREVDRFIQVRRGMRLEVDGWGRGRPQAGSLTATRDRALRVYGLKPESYVRIRRQYRAWREGKLSAGSPLAAALEHRREDLKKIDLGTYESLDG